MEGQSQINPHGYGTPIVGIFSSAGELLLYAVTLQAFMAEAGYYVSQCNIDEDDEDGVQADIIIDTDNPEMIDHPYFSRGAALRIRLGYLTKEGPRFGPAYHLVLKDFKADYADSIKFTLKLVDTISFTEMTKDSDEIEPLDVLEQQLREDNKDLEDAQTPAEVEKIALELQKLRSNVRVREELTIFMIKGRSATRSDMPGKYMAFYSIDDVREYMNRPGHKEYYGDERKLTDFELIDKFGSKGTGLNSLRIGSQKQRTKDLYGIPMGNRGRGYSEWLEKLEELEVMPHVRRLAEDLRTSPREVINNRDLMDQVIEAIFDEKIYPVVKNDINLSIKENIQKELNETPGGPHRIVDTGEGGGSPIKSGRNFNGRTFMNLKYRGGSGDLLRVSFETDYYSTSVVSSQAVSVDDDSGDIVSVTELNYGSGQGATIERTPEEVKRFVDSAVAQINENQLTGENKDIGLNQFIDGPTRRYIVAPDWGTRHEYQDASGNFVSGRSTTAVYLPPQIMDVVASRPGTIEQIQNEIDNRRGDRNIKQVTADAVIIGRPDVRTGFIFYLDGVAKRLVGRYYALSIKHSISPDNGYTTTLKLGKIPGVQSIGRSIVKNELQKVDNENDVMFKITKGHYITMSKNGETEVFARDVVPIVPSDPETPIIYYTPQGAVFNHEANWVGISTNRGYLNFDEFKRSYWDNERWANAWQDALSGAIPASQIPNKPEPRKTVPAGLTGSTGVIKKVETSDRVTPENYEQPD